jgi:hypothetical protein
MEYGEYRFRAEMLQKNQARAIKNEMVAASFTAWQVICSQGGKIPWEQYLEMVGLAERVAPSRGDVTRTMSIANSILSRQGFKSKP